MSEPRAPDTPDPKDTRRMKAALVATAALVFAAAPLAVPFQGFDPGLFPNPQEDPPIQPAGYAFAIWGPIYLWLLAHGIFGLIRRADDPDWDAPRWPLAFSLAVGATWLAVAQVSAIWATVLIWAMWAAAVLALLRASGAGAARARGRERWLLRGPLGLYAGWLTAASVVSVGLLGAGYGIGPGQGGWAWIGLVLALGLALAVQSALGRRAADGAPEYAAGVVWALIGVAVANLSSALALSAAAVLGAALLAGRALRAAA